MNKEDLAFKEYLMKESCDDCVQTPEYKRFFVAGAAWQKDKTIGDVLGVLDNEEYRDKTNHMFINWVVISKIKALSEGKR